MIKDHLK